MYGTILKKSSPVFILLAGLIVSYCAKPCNMHREELYALEYGSSLFPEKLITDTAPPGKRVSFSWIFYCLKTNGRTVLVDTGFTDRKYVNSFQLTRYNNPLALLKSIGVEPGAVTDIILTHSHFDHIGSAHHFPNAGIYIQRGEYEAFRKSARYRQYRSFYAAREGKGLLHLLDGEFKFSSEVRTIPAGGHTPGSQGVILSHGGKQYIITGDECYLRKYCRECRPLPEGSLWSRRNNLLFLQRILSARKKEIFIILPMHDPVISKEYSAVQEHVFKIF